MLPELVLHRSLHSVRHLLPHAPPLPVIHHIQLSFATEAEKEFYFAVQGHVLSQVAGSSYDLDHLSPQQAFLLLLRLRQLSIHPQIYIQAKRRESISYRRHDWTQPSTKLLAVRDIILGDLIQQDKEVLELELEPHRYLLFCQFHDEMLLIRDYLLTLGLFQSEDILSYHGGLTSSERAQVLRASKRSRSPTVLLLQLHAGGCGLNLQEYDRILFLSPWWTSALMDQAVARAVRMGQTRRALVYHLHLHAESHDSSILIDALISDKAEAKRGMLEELFDLLS
jgi:SNF2 family DNA or RNA helicase